MRDILIYWKEISLIDRMKILVLNVDRDNDLGRKAEIRSPIIGRDENIKSAERLALVDPEDSDVNSIFMAISIYDELKKEGKDVEVATICGDIPVGINSDQKIADQLELVLKRTGADEVILVTDGSEDEYILPIIESRIKIRSVRRVTVKQSRAIEDTYYRIVKLLEDEKIRKQFLLPIALVLIVWSIFALLNMTQAGFGAIILTLGAYLLIRAMKWENIVSIMWEEFKSGFLTGRIFIYTSGIAVLILIASTIYAYNQTISFSPVPTLWHFFVIFTRNIIWGLVGAGLLLVFGRAVDMKVRKRNVWRYWLAPFSLLSFGFLGDGILEVLYRILYGPSANPFQILGSYPSTLMDLIIGILIAIAGVVSYHYVKDVFMVEAEGTGGG